MGIFTKKKPVEEDENPFFTFPKLLMDDEVNVNAYYYPPSGSYARPLFTQHVGGEQVFFNNTGTFNPYKYPVLSTDEGLIEPRAVLSDDLVDQLWKKMYERPVIVRCSYCNSHNVVTSPTCIQCGAPMGDYKRMKNYG